MTLDDIRAKARFLSSTNSTSFPDSVLIPEANNAYDRVVALIKSTNGRWQWDDTNKTDLPIASTNLVANQQDYLLSIDFLDILRVEVIDSSGQWHKLSPIDTKDVFTQAMSDYMNGTGMPVQYDKLANSIFLYPTPSFSAAPGIKVYYQRGPSYFTTADTTKKPGFSELYHDLIPLWCAYNFAIANGKANANQLMAQIALKEDQLKEDYALRDKDDHPGLRPRPMRWN